MVKERAMIMVNGLIMPTLKTRRKKKLPCMTRKRRVIEKCVDVNSIEEERKSLFLTMMMMETTSIGSVRCGTTWRG